VLTVRKGCELIQTSYKPNYRLKTRAGNTIIYMSVHQLELLVYRYLRFVDCNFVTLNVETIIDRAKGILQIVLKFQFDGVC